MKVFLEGYYNGAGMMKPVLYNQGVSSNTNITDEVTVELRNSTSPYAIVYSYTGYLNTNGIIACNFPFAADGKPYYIAVKHRNSIHTWSANPVVLTNSFLYDFTLSNTQVYGLNEVLLESGKYGIYASDINQDDAVNNSDFSLWESDANNFMTGYLLTDINGDASIDNSDFQFWELNANEFVGEVSP
jgi:hypothetical protein